MTKAKMYTLVLTEAEIDVLYDALTELGYSTDDYETLELISTVEGKIYNESKQNV